MKLNLTGNDHEIEFHKIEICIFQEMEFFCKIDQEIEKALGALGGHYFRLFYLTLPNLT
jgi:hypothetical protein